MPSSGSHSGLISKSGLIRNHLVTAEITYRLPDYPLLLQLYVWQDYDLVPKLPKFNAFLEYWREGYDMCGGVLNPLSRDEIFATLAILTNFKLDFKS
jgi:uncharacterized protein Usg